MKLILRLALPAVLALTLAGCAPAGTGTTGQVASETTPPVMSKPTTEPPVPGPKTWKAMPMGVQEKAALAGIGKSIAMYVAAEEKAGRKPVSLAGKTPRFVGYQVRIWSKQADAKFQFANVDVIGGRIDALGEVEHPLEARMISLSRTRLSTTRQASSPRARARRTPWPRRSRGPTPASRGAPGAPRSPATTSTTS